MTDRDPCSEPVFDGCVMQLTPNLDVGGAQENLLTVAKYFRALGCRNIVCSFADGPLRREVERLGVPVELLPPRRYPALRLPWFVAEMVARRRALRRIIDEHDVTVVQTRGLGTLDFLAMTLRRSDVQVWWTIENVEFLVRAEHQLRYPWAAGPKRAMHRLLYRIGAGWVDGILVVSAETEHSFRTAARYRGDNVFVVLNAVDVERYPAPVDRGEMRASLGFGPTDHVMTTVATFKRQKGHEYLVRAFGAVADRHPELHLLFVGEGELGPSLRAQAVSTPGGERIHFVGTRRDVAEILTASDSFVLPSLWEGLPIALVEAMASRLPIIATDVSGTRQAMIDGATGWLVPPGDARCLAAAMSELLADGREAARRAAEARDRVESAFHARDQARQFLELFAAAR